MPWTPQSIENIPRQYKGIPFLSSTCVAVILWNLITPNP